MEENLCGATMLSEPDKDTDEDCKKFCNNEFYRAIEDEDLESIEELLKKYGSNVLVEKQDIASRNHFTKGVAIHPVHLAASLRRVQSMQSLLAAGADVEMRDQLGRTPLHLLIVGWPSSLTGSSRLDSKFQRAATGKCKQAEAFLRLLCEHGANVNAEIVEKSQTALHILVHYRAVSAIQILASYGANVNAVNSSGMTPLHMAAGILHKDIIACLIRHGADINMEMQHTGNTPLHLAAVAMVTKVTKTPDSPVSSISELLQKGADPNRMNAAGMTALHEVCSMGNEQLVDLLLSYGADINKLTKAGENCLFLFLSQRANVRNSPLLGKLLCLTTPLTIFSQNGSLPSTLTKPCFFKQKHQLLKLIQQPRRLQDICKIDIYLRHVRAEREKPKVLPKKLFDFVFNQWDSIRNVSFEMDDEQDIIK
ncbi:ankyrin repeat domain-containing protein 61-like [Pholidichthys leucotaenia]